MILWREFTHQGMTYDLSHVHPKMITITQPPVQNNGEMSYQVRIIYGLHVFTRGLVNSDPPDLIYGDTRESRAFDFDRYLLSKKLPNIVENLASKKCYKTNHNNYFTVEIVSHCGKSVDYEVFFIVSRATEKKVVNLKIISAYVRDNNRQYSQPKKDKPIKLTTILYKTANKK